MSSEEQAAGGALASAIELAESGPKDSLTVAKESPRHHHLTLFGRSRGSREVRTDDNDDNDDQLQEFKWNEVWRWLAPIAAGLHFYHVDMNKDSVLLYYELVALVVSLVLGAIAGMVTSYDMEQLLDWEQWCKSDSHYAECFEESISSSTISTTCHQHIVNYQYALVTSLNVLVIGLAVTMVMYVVVILGKSENPRRFARFFRWTLPFQAIPLWFACWGLGEFFIAIGTAMEMMFPNYPFFKGKCLRLSHSNTFVVNGIWSDIWLTTACSLIAFMPLIVIRLKFVAIHPTK